MNKAKPPRKVSTPPNVPLLILIALRKWGLIAAVLGIALSAVAVVLTLKFWEPVYEAKQFVRVIQNREYTDIENEGRTKTDPKSELAPIRNEYLLGKMLLTPAMSSRPEIEIADLKKKIRYESGGGELYSIICTDKSPKFAATIAQELTNEFISYNREYRDESLRVLKENLAEEIEAAKRRLQQVTDSLTELNLQQKKSNPLNGSADPEGSFLAELMTKSFEQKNLLVDLKDELDRLESSKDSIADQFEDVFIEDQVNADPAILNLDQQIRMFRLEVAKYSRLGSGHDKVSTLENSISRSEHERDNRYANKFAILKANWIANREQTLETTIEKRKMEIARLERSLQTLDTETTKLKADQETANRLVFQIDQKSKEQDRAIQQLEDWMSKKDRIESKTMSLYLVTIVGPSEVAIPKKPVEQYPTKQLGLAVLVGLLLPFATAVAIEFRLQRIANSEQVRVQVPIEMLGEVADLPVRTLGGSKLNSKRMNKQLRLYEESVDNLSAILAQMDDKTKRIFSISSAASNEGKTTLSFQLAVSSARSNAGRTLLIDADLRSPSLHRLLDRPLDRGLCDVLSGKVSLVDAIEEDAVDGLDLITAGRITTNPRRYFSGNHWAELLSEAQKRYDHIIVDTPPVLAASESLAISFECDFTILCMLRDVSRADAVKRAHERLVAANVNIVGTVFGGVPQSEYASKYGSYEYNL